GAIDTRPAAPGSDDLAIVATLRAKLAAEGSGATVGCRGASSVKGMDAPGLDAPSSSGGEHPGALRAEDVLREHVRAGREGAFLCLVVDASGSMGARQRLARVKG